MRPIIRKNVSWQKIGEEVLVMDTVYQKKAHSLNQSAAIIWENCTGDNNLEQIAKLMTEKYDIGYEQAFSDTEKTIKHFVSLDLVELLDG